MDVAVGEQAQEVERLAVPDAVGDEVLPGRGLEERAVLDGLLDELRTLGVNLAAAQGVVADLGVAHILIGGQADGGAMGLQPGIGAGLEETVKVGGLRLGDGITGAAVPAAHAVHDDQDNGFLVHRCSSR